MGSEIQFIDDMVDSHVHVGEQGHMFTTLKVTENTMKSHIVAILRQYYFIA